MVSSTPSPAPFKLSPPSRGPVRRLVFSLMAPPLERLLHFPELNRIYDAVGSPDDPAEFLSRSLKALGIEYEVSPEHLRRIPKTGPLIVVANHPYGGLEGMILLSLLLSVRPDSKVLANYLLHHIPQLRARMIFVDPFDRPGSVRFNLVPMKQCIAWLREGGVLGVFPAGEVSHLDLKERVVRDPRWSRTVARLIRRTEAPVLPVFFQGRNSALFQMAGLIHPKLRTLMLPRALVKPHDRSVGVRIGNPVPFAQIAAFTSDTDLLNYLRMRTYILRPTGGRKVRGKVRLARGRVGRHQPTVEPVEPAALAEELSSLPADQLLLASGEYQIWLGRASQIPGILREIGRLREVTFRAAGEGTGKALDLDRFDTTYQHLFCWDKTAGRLVGAYRLGATDEILPREGARGLYTSELFKFADALFEQIDPAVELGRSFVRVEYQRKHSPLTLLWQGIGRFVVRHPRYRVMFGPVSITNDYQSVSQQMMIAFLRAHSSLPEFARLVKPRKAPRGRLGDDVQAATRLVTDINEVSALIAEIESDHKGVPILLKQYLRLNAKFISCNVDPDFSNVLDGLMLVDLAQTDPRILARHMGKEGAARFFEYHGLTDRQTA